MLVSESDFPSSLDFPMWTIIRQCHRGRLGLVHFKTHNWKKDVDWGDRKSDTVIRKLGNYGWGWKLERLNLPMKPNRQKRLVHFRKAKSRRRKFMNNSIAAALTTLLIHFLSRVFNYSKSYFCFLNDCEKPLYVMQFLPHIVLHLTLMWLMNIVQNKKGKRILVQPRLIIIIF